MIQHRFVIFAATDGGGEGKEELGSDDRLNDSIAPLSAGSSLKFKEVYVVRFPLTLLSCDLSCSCPVGSNPCQ